MHVGLVLPWMFAVNFPELVVVVAVAVVVLREDIPKSNSSRMEGSKWNQTTSFVSENLTTQMKIYSRKWNCGLKW